MNFLDDRYGLRKKGEGVSNLKVLKVQFPPPDSIRKEDDGFNWMAPTGSNDVIKPGKNVLEKSSV